MSLTRVYAVFLRYTYILRGNPQRLFQIFIWGIVDIIIWGFLTIYLDQIGQTEFSLVPMLLGAVILYSFFIRVQHAVTTPALEDIWVRNLLNFFGSPLQIGEYALGLILSGVVVGAVGLLVLVILAFIFFGFSLLQFGALLVPFLLILFLFGVAAGIIGAAIVMRFGPSAEWFVWPIPALLNPFVGVFYPVSVLPHWMQWISQALAPTYVFDGMRAALLGGVFNAEGFAIGLLLAVATVILAYVMYVAVFRSVLRSGAFARYSAESVI